KGVNMGINVGRALLGVSTGGLSEVARGAQGKSNVFDIGGSKAEGGQSTDPNAYKKGAEVGKARAEELYGSEEIQDITTRRRAALDGNDPASTRLRESKNAQIRAAKASGASQDQLTQIERQANVDIGQQEFKSQEQALGEYQSLIGNILGGKTSMEMGYAGLANSSQQAIPAQAGGMTVICTELHVQGYLPDEILEKDREYGRNIRLNDIAVYIGYIWLARPIVAGMRKSDTFAYLVSIPALNWAYNMADEKVGIIEKIGKPICRFVGNILIALNNRGIVYA